MQIERRKEPYPWTWEIPAAVAVGMGLLGVAGVHIGRALANLIAGGGWTWPERGGLFRSVFGVLGGDAAAGLDPVPSQLAPAGMVIGWVVATGLLLLVAATAAALIAVRRWGPGRMRGMATAAEAEKTLGVARLKKNKKIIRPDLYQPTISGGHDGYHPGT